MKTRTLMTITSIFFLFCGILMIFLPEEIASYFGASHNYSLIFHTIGALYFGFGMLNWMARDQRIGGIYGRAIAVGNFSHFFVGAIPLIKLTFRNPAELPIVFITLVYVLFALAFGYLMFRSPEEFAQPAKMPASTMKSRKRMRK